MQQHYETFVAAVEHAATGADLPQFVKDEFDAYLDCGIPACGFMRLALRGLRTRHTGGVQLQAAQHLPVMWHKAHGGDGGLSGGQHYPARAGAAGRSVSGGLTPGFDWLLPGLMDFLNALAHESGSGVIA